MMQHEGKANRLPIQDANPARDGIVVVSERSELAAADDGILDERQFVESISLLTTRPLGHGSMLRRSRGARGYARASVDAAPIRHRRCQNEHAI